MTINPGDIVTLNAVVVDKTSSGNLIVKLKRGGRVLICPDEITMAMHKPEKDPIENIMKLAGSMYMADQISEGSYNDIVDILKGVINDSV